MLIVDRLSKVFSPDQLILTPPSEYFEDASLCQSFQPLCVIEAWTGGDVQEVLKIANECRIPVTVRGAGTSKSGGAVPEQGGIVLSVEKLNKILNVDVINRTVTVEPGVIVSTLQQAVLQEGLWYPVDPASLNQCTIGGNVACNAGGPRARKYGVTGDYVLGLQGIYASGEPFQFGGKLYKDVAGYDLKRLMIGSEGTLGVITSITLKLLTPPKEEFLLWMTFDSLDDGLSYLLALLQSRVEPSVAEFIPKTCLKSVEKYHQTTYSFSDGSAHLLLAFDDDNYPEGISRYPHFWAKTESDKEQLWRIRRDISLSLSYCSLHKFSEDITVPVSKLPELMRGLQRLSDRSPYLCVGYGHLGDGNVHVNVLNIDQPELAWQKDRHQLANQIMTLGVNLGGTLSGEHGIGLTKKSFMPLYFTPHDIQLMKGIRKLCDPNGILNPSKVV